ncbi:Heterokaryon incompatibility protein (HET) domain containing protein [Rhypophila decipiens]
MSILKWSFHNGNPFVEIDSESPDLQVICHPYSPSDGAISFEKSLCQSCKSLIIRMSVPNENLTTEDQKSFIQFEHLDGEMVSLRVSAQECPLCRIILGELNVSHASLHKKYEVSLNLEDGRSFSVHNDMSQRTTFQLFQSLDRPDIDKSERIIYLYHHCDKHAKCTGTRVTRPTRPLPKRVLDIHCLDSIRLHDPTEPELSPYATLSYCCGAGVPLKTTTTNLLSHRDKIPFSSFPKTLQDSIQLANGLGFRYLWIDALCIIQDDEKDWAEQAAEMTSIYEGCSLNIAILDSRDCDSGILPTMDDISVVVGTLDNSRSSEHSQNGGVQIRAASAGIRIGAGAKTCPLSTRGWTFQETIVSVSTLFISRSGLWWDCCSKPVPPFYSVKSMWCDCTNNSPPPSAKPGPQTPRDYFNRRMKIWCLWVVEFSRRSLSKPTDKLPAIAGLAAKLSAVLGWTYAAGLWTQDLHYALTWSAAVPGTLIRHKAPLRAPSWSWASVYGEVTYSFESSGDWDREWHVEVNEGEDLQIFDVVIDEHFAGSFGTVSRGRLEAVATMYALATVPGLDGSGLGFRHSSRDLYIELDEHLAGYLESGDSNGTSQPQPSSYWVARICSIPEYNRKGDSLVFYLALKQNLAAAEKDLPTFSRIGLVDFRDIDRTADSTRFSGGIRQRITIL